MPRLTQEQHFNRTREHVSKYNNLTTYQFFSLFPRSASQGPMGPWCHLPQMLLALMSLTASMDLDLQLASRRQRWTILLHEISKYINFSRRF